MNTLGDAIENVTTVQGHVWVHEDTEKLTPETPCKVGRQPSYSWVSVLDLSSPFAQQRLLDVELEHRGDIVYQFVSDMNRQFAEDRAEYYRSRVDSMKP